MKQPNFLSGTGQNSMEELKEKEFLSKLYKKLNNEEREYLNGVRDLAEEAENIRDLVEKDHLTKAYNRRKFDEVLGLEIKKTDRRFNRAADRRLKMAADRRLEMADRRAKGLSLLFCDIDHFKYFNDNYGHPEGDNILVNLVKSLSDGLRDYESGSVFRYGGEEFAILVQDTSLKEGIVIAERLRKDVKSFPDLKVYDKPLTISIGVSNYKENSRNKNELIKLADEALYKVKQGGRDGVCSIQNFF